MNIATCSHACSPVVQRLVICLFPAPWYLTWISWRKWGKTRGHFACDHPHVCSQGSKNRPLLHTGDRRDLMKKLSTAEVFGNGTTGGLLVVTYMCGARASAAIIAGTTPDDCPHAEMIQLSHLRSPYDSTFNSNSRHDASCRSINPCRDRQKGP